MKKLLVLSLCAVLTSSFLVGCGGTETNTEGNKSEQTQEGNATIKEDEPVKEASKINVAQLDMGGLTKEKFSDFDNIDEISKEAVEHQKRLVAGNEVMGDTFENSSTGGYKRGAINSETNFVVDFTNKDENSSLKTIATEFAVSTTDKNCGNKIVMHFNVNKEKGLIISDDEIGVMKALIPELEKEDIKKHIADLVKKSLDESMNYNHDYTVDDPKALFLETEPANEEAEDLVVKLVYWGNYNYV
ncbi:MAG: hypothetical protein ACRCWM_02535 [Sarcina sp.]